MAKIIKFKGKTKEGTTEEEIPEEEIPTILMCPDCGNSLFIMMMMPEGDIAPVCQHCHTEFDWENPVEFEYIIGLNVPGDRDDGVEVELEPELQKALDEDDEI